MDYSHLRLSDWPFTTVPSERFSTFLADRRGLSTELDTLIFNLTRRRPSTMHLLWAWFGAGKTHTMFYLKFLATKHHLLPVYTEFPRAPRTFADVVRPLARSLPLDRLAAQYEEVATNPSHNELIGAEFERAIKTYFTASHSVKELAARWLAGEELRAADLRQLQLARYLRDSDDAVRFVSQLVALLGNPLADNPARLIWMIDEFQRVEDLAPSVRDQILTSVHSVFNACPDDMTIVLSFSGKPQSDLPDWLTPELRDRIGIEQTMLLPPLAPDDAVTFLSDVLGHFRTGPRSKWPDFPFDRAALRRIVEFVQKGGDLKPRSLMQFANAVLETADPRIQAGQIEVVEAAFVDEVLKTRHLLSDAE